MTNGCDHQNIKSITSDCLDMVLQGRTLREAQTGTYTEADVQRCADIYRARIPGLDEAELRSWVHSYTTPGPVTFNMVYNFIHDYAGELCGFEGADVVYVAPGVRF